AVVLAVAVILAVLLNTLVERPLQSWGRHAGGQKADIVPLAIGLVVMLVFSSAVANALLASQQEARQHHGSQFALHPEQYPGGRQAGDQKADIVPLAMGLVVMLVFSNGVANALLASQQEAQQHQDSQFALDPEQYPGARSTLEDGPDVPEVENFAPSVEELAQVEQEYITRNCRQAGENAPGSDEVTLCEDPAAPENPSKTIVLAPDSHAGHWEQTFRELGREHNWEVILAIKSGCNFS